MRGKSFFRFLIGFLDSVIGKTPQKMTVFFEYFCGVASDPKKDDVAC